MGHDWLSLAVRLCGQYNVQCPMTKYFERSNCALPKLVRNGTCLKLRTLSSDARGELTHRQDSRALLLAFICGHGRLW
jgi:hypothetical protein